MGHGIAQVAAAAGYAVIMRDVSAEALESRTAIHRNAISPKAIQLKKDFGGRGGDEILQRIERTTNLEEI